MVAAVPDDGREKALEEYIFDRHYVVTLIDKVVETLGMMVFDACVLVPERGKEFYHVYDRQVVTAKRLLGEEPTPEKPGSKKEPFPGTKAVKNPRVPRAEEAEYQLLFKALNWFNGKEYAGEEVFDSTVMEFMEQLFFKVCLNLETIGIKVDQASFKQGQLAENLEFLEMSKKGSINVKTTA